ncbi:hypothetical protein Tco_0669096 [Tanacetum coccineum]
MEKRGEAKVKSKPKSKKAKVNKSQPNGQLRKGPFMAFYQTLTPAPNYYTSPPPFPPLHSWHYSLTLPPPQPAKTITLMHNPTPPHGLLYMLAILWRTIGHGNSRARIYVLGQQAE